MRKTAFADGEFYHVYNRGVDKREIFIDQYDLNRFFQSMKEFNTLEPIGSIYEKSFLKAEKVGGLETKLVEFICYCLNPNHFHFVLQQVSENGIEKFMHRLSTGYTRYFNERYNRSGSLFQGSYKAAHINSNEYLLHLSAYVNLNGRVHQLGGLASKSSWAEYLGREPEPFCKKEDVLDQFQEIKDYENFASESLQDILERRRIVQELEGLLLEA